MSEVSSEILEISPRTKAYIRAANSVQELLQQAEMHPSSQEDYQAGIQKGQLKMHMLEDDAAAEFVTVYEYREPEDIAAARAVIESLREDEDFGIAIFEEDIEKELATLPPSPRYAPEVTEFATDYLTRLGAYITALTNNGNGIAAEAVPSGAIEDAEKKPGGNEQETKPSLVITVYKDHVIQLGEDGEMIPLLRSMEIPKSTEEERYIADARLAALKFITSYDPETNDTLEPRGANSSSVWQSYAPGVEYKHNGAHESLIISFLRGITYDGKPLVDIYKPTETAKRTYHRNGSFAIEFVESTERSGLDNREVFELPTGELVIAKLARFSHLLLRANADNPLSLEQLISSDVYTQEEKAKKVSIVVSSLVSYLRRRLEQTSCIDSFAIHKVDNSDGPASYWMEYTGDEAIGRELYPFLYSNNEVTVTAEDLDQKGTEKGVRFEETEEEKARSTADCQLIVAWLMRTRKHLEKEGLIPFDINDAAKLEISEELVSKNPFNVEAFVLLRQIFIDVDYIISDEALVDLMIERIPQDDPRWPVIDYLTAEDPTGKHENNLKALFKVYPAVDPELGQRTADAFHRVTHWETLSKQERLALGQEIFILLDLVRDGLERGSGIKQIDANKMVEAVNEILVQSTGGMKSLTHNLKAILNTATRRWLEKTAANMMNPTNGNDNSQRARKRAWASEFRTEMNRYIESSH